MLVIAASDLLDGFIARRLATAGSKGALIDVACDFVVITAATAALGWAEGRYFVLVGLIVAAFLSWAVYNRKAGRLAYTRLGKYNGFLCYVLLITVSTRPWLAPLEIHTPLIAERALYSLVSIWLGASIIENIGRTWRVRAINSSP